MVLPEFNAEVSLYVSQRHYSYRNMNLLNMDIRPQLDIEACYETCRENCCIWLEGPDGPISGSEFCRPSCLRGCQRVCAQIDN